MWERVCASSRCNLIEKVLLRIACSGTMTAWLIVVIVGLPEFFVLQRFSLRFCGDFSKLKQNIACKILFEEERQALKQSGEKRKPLAKFALPRRDGLFCATIF